MNAIFGLLPNFAGDQSDDMREIPLLLKFLSY
jgi:hypothetical protein